MSCVVVIAAVVVAPIGLMTFLVARHKFEFGWALLAGLVCSFGALALLSGLDINDLAAATPGDAQDKGLAILRAAAEVCGGIGVLIGVAIGLGGGVAIAEMTKEK